MAERRMFAKTIVLSDAFLDMPLGARCLYMTFGMVADDDGFVNNAKSVIRLIGASEDDLRILIAKKFILLMDDGLIVIKHWRINNYLRNDRYQETKYIEEKAKLLIDEKGAYKFADESLGIPSMVYPGKDSIGKDSIGNSIGAKRKRFTPPTLEEVQAYCRERNNNVDAKKFYEYYNTGNWKDAKGNPVKNWKQKLITWEGREKGNKVPDFSNPYKHEEEKPIERESEDVIRERLLNISSK